MNKKDKDNLAVFIGIAWFFGVLFLSGYLMRGTA